MRHRWAFIEVSAPQKITAKTLSVGLFCGTGFYKRQEKKIQRKEKKYLSLAIGENYINKMFLFFNILFMDVFTYRLTAKNPKILPAEKKI